MSTDKPSLNAAYALQTPQDNQRLYADWAKTYDSEFAARMAYRVPQLVAEAFHGSGPVLDVGAGTGLLGQALAKRGVGPIDGIDISAEMLDVARTKGVYRDLTFADLTQPLTLPRGIYHGVVSSGTFTSGHVGPDALDGLIDLAAPGAVFAISIYEPIFVSMGFEAKLAALLGRITPPEIQREPVYADAPDPEHRDDTALIVRFSTL